MRSILLRCEGAGAFGGVRSPSSYWKDSPTLATKASAEAPGASLFVPSCPIRKRREVGVGAGEWQMQGQRMGGLSSFLPLRNLKLA